MTGPFETEEQARLLPAVQAVYDAFDADPGAGKMAPHNHRLLCEALDAAGVQVGAYDHRILLWLAGWEPSTVAVVASWVQRARPRGDDLALILAALDDAAEARRERAAVNCYDCATGPTGRCDQHRADLQAAAAYAALRARLGGAP